MGFDAFHVLWLRSHVVIIWKVTLEFLLLVCNWEGWEQSLSRICFFAPASQTLSYCFSMQIYHADNKAGLFDLQSLIKTWLATRPGGVYISEVKGSETSSLQSFISEISEEVCFQLHSGIMKAARKVVLDEIIRHIIAECVAMKKAHRHTRLEVVNENARICYLDSRTVCSPVSSKRVMTWEIKFVVSYMSVWCVVWTA